MGDQIDQINEGSVAMCPYCDSKFEALDLYTAQSLRNNHLRHCPKAPGNNSNK